MEYRVGLLSLVILLVVIGVQGKKEIYVGEQRVRFTQNPDDLTVVLSSSVELNCAAVDREGRSLPIKWQLDGAWLDNFNSSLDVSGSLKLRNITQSDQGVYQCGAFLPRESDEEGANPMVLLSPGANITVSAPPKLLEGLKDQIDVRVGGSARFQCKFEAVPPAFITWFRNGLPLSLSTGTDASRFIPVTSEILQIVNVKPEDGGSYLCSASNIVGNLTSRPGTLTTSSVLPPFDSHGNFATLNTQSAPRNETVTVGDDALFECLFNPNPSQVTWKRLGGEPATERMETFGSNLIIRSVTVDDEGWYSCSAGATESLVQLKAYLSVNVPPKLREFPEEQRKRRGETARFRCFANGKPVPEITWYKNGQRILPQGRVKLFPLESEPPLMMIPPTKNAKAQYKRDLVISSVQPEDEGMYQCFVRNAAGMVSGAAALFFRHPEGNESSQPPGNLHGKVNQKEERVELEWTAPPGVTDDTSVIYIVHFYKTDGGKENTQAHM